MSKKPLDCNYGTYFIMPLKCSLDRLDAFRSNKLIRHLEDNGWHRYTWAYSNYYEHINRLFSSEKCSGLSEFGKGIIGVELEITNLTINNMCINTEDSVQYHIRGEEGLTLYFRSFHIVIAHTGVGFLIIGIESGQAYTAKRIRREGLDKNDECIFERDNCNEAFSTYELVRSLLNGTGFTDYHDEITLKSDGCSLFRDVTIYKVGFFIEREEDICKSSDQLHDMMRKCINLRFARAIDCSESFAYSDYKCTKTYAAPNANGYIRWATYSLFEHTTQIIRTTREERIINNPDDNYLPFILIALYIRYSCMFYSEMLSTPIVNKNNTIKWFEEQMLRLKAFGVILPCEMTPYSNINSFFIGQQEIYELPEAISALSDKMVLLQGIKAKRFEHLGSIITLLLSVFGLISIIADSIAIIEHYNQIARPISFLTVIGVISLIICIVLVVIRIWINKRWKDNW